MQIPAFELERYFARYEFTTEFLMCTSDCESMNIHDLLQLEDGSDVRFSRTWLGYTESQGSLSLRAAICDLYETIQPEQVLVHSGAEEAVFLFMHAALQPGEHVIVHSPCYQSLAEVARSIGCEVSAWMAREENNWAPDLDELNQLLRPNTCAIVINTPHNPTGWLMSRPEFIALHQFVHKNGLLLFSDEVYRESEYSPADRLPAACDQGEYAISLGVTSKTYGLPGLRIGWVATHNREILQRMASLKDYTTICSSAPSEFLAELALRRRQALIDRNLEIIRANLELVDDLFSRHPDLFRWVRPRAGSIAFPSLLKGNVEEFCDALVREIGVLLAPGSIFGDSGNHFRLGLGRRNFPQGLAHLEEYLDRYPAR